MHHILHWHKLAYAALAACDAHADIRSQMAYAGYDG